MDYLLIGKQGEIVDFIDLSSDTAKEKLKKLPPKIELSCRDVMDKRPRILLDSGLKNEKDQMINFAEKAYQTHNRFGHFGDVISVTTKCIQIEDVECEINFIGSLQFPKPGMASDLVPIIKDGNDQYFFVGILRKFPPAVGKLALIGGFREINGLHFDSVLENIIPEAKDEVGIRIIPVTDFPDEVLGEPYPERVRIIACFEGVNYMECDSDLLHVQSVFPIANQREKNYGEKRVSQTCAYTFLAEVNRVLSENFLRTCLKPGDDAMEAIAWNITRRGFPDLALEHHRKIFRLAMKKLSLGEMIKE